MSENLTLIVSLFINSEKKLEFEEYERRASKIMNRYGGSIDRRISLNPRGDHSQPQEVHIVSFPSQEAFDNYRQDPDTVSLASLRATAILKTVIWFGSDSTTFL